MRQILILCIICAAACSVNAQISPVYAGRFQFILDSVCNRMNIKGVSAAIYRPGEGIWTGTHGESAVGVPLDKSMCFPIGSNTKTFVAAAMLELEEMGKLQLSDAIGKWITHPNVNSNIKIEQLLNHTSGLYDYIRDNDFQQAWTSDFNKVWKAEDMYQFIKAPANPPGVAWQYSNTNYLLAGIILTKVYGKSLEATLRDLVFKPARLSNTFVYPQEQPSGTIPHGWSDGVTTSKLADMYTAIGYRNTAYLSMAAGAGCIVSTAEDNVKFWNALMTGEIVTPASVSRMKKLVTLAGADPYGLGMYQWPANGHTVYNHPGTCFAFLNENLYDNDNGICITALSNQDSVDNNYLFATVVYALHAATLDMPPLNISDRSKPTTQISLYPNPANKELNIQTIIAPFAISVYNTLGKLSLSVQNPLHANNVLDISHLPSGRYFIRVQLPDAIASVSFLKE